MTVTLTIALRATGKARPRERGRLPTAYRDWKALACMLLTGELRRSAWRRVGPAGPQQPVGVRVVSYAVRPKRAPAWLSGGDLARWKAGEPMLRLATPDCDNLEGAVWDALNDTGLVWHDDAQAVSLGCWEWYAQPGESPRIEVTLTLLDPWSDPATTRR